VGLAAAPQNTIDSHSETLCIKLVLARAFQIAFHGGSVMGVGVASLAVLGLRGLFVVFAALFMDGDWYSPTLRRVIEVVTGFSLGAESIALFARVGGGIYTKAADVGADLVGKIEAGIPEDDPRNPAVIADNVGDNVGDIAGRGADLLGSYVATILATMVLGQEMSDPHKANSGQRVSACRRVELGVAAAPPQAGMPTASSHQEGL
jgi:K(+)-stimulated pyrophosphate-energized sodium pump